MSQRDEAAPVDAKDNGIVIEIVLIVAAAENGVIGSKGSIPWRVKSDVLRLKAMTMGKPVLMGRKTFESLRRALPDILSSNTGALSPRIVNLIAELVQD